MQMFLLMSLICNSAVEDLMNDVWEIIYVLIGCIVKRVDR